MGQIKNIKLHIVTDIKKNKQKETRFASKQRLQLANMGGVICIIASKINNVGVDEQLFSRCDDLAKVILEKQFKKKKKLEKRLKIFRNMEVLRLQTHSYIIPTSIYEHISQLPNLQILNLSSKFQRY